MSPKQQIINFLNKHTKLEEQQLKNLIETPPQNLGDYAFPCFILTKTLKKSPIEIAKTLQKLPTPQQIEKIQATGPYLNFYIKKEYILKQKHKQKIKKEKIMIEFSNPNPFKAFHVGHLRNTTLGEAITRLLTYQGYKTIPVNYYNDTGKHVATCIWGLENLKIKQLEDKGEQLGNIYAEASTKKLQNKTFQKQISIIHQKLENKDKKYLKIYKQNLKHSENHFKQIYKDLQVNFKKIYYDSEFTQTGKDIVNNLKKLKIAEKSEGAIIANLEKYNLNTLVLLRTDKTAMYITKDLSMAIQRIKEYKLDRSIYVVASEQNLHFKQLFKLLELTGYKQAKKCFHLSYGLVHLPEGRMSSRKGRIILYNEIKRNLIKTINKEIEKRHKTWPTQRKLKAQQAIFSAAIKFDMLLQDPNKEIIFDINKAISFEGDTGPYIQYTHARASSILKKAKTKVTTKINYKLLSSTKESALISKISKLQETIEASAEQYKPSLLAHYLLELSHLFNDFYHSCPCISENKELQKARLLLVQTTKETISKGLNLLAIQAPDEM